MLGTRPLSTFPLSLLQAEFESVTATATLRYATHSFATRGTDAPANTFIGGRINAGLTIARTLRQGPAGQFGSILETTFGELRLNNADGALDVLARDYYADGRPVRLKIGAKEVTAPTRVMPRFIATGEGAASTDAALPYGMDYPSKVNFFEEDWTGADGTSWNAAKWGITAFGTASATIQSNRGRITLPDASNWWVHADAVIRNLDDCEITFSFQMSASGPQFHAISFRASSVWSTVNREHAADGYVVTISESFLTLRTVVAQTRTTLDIEAKTWGTGEWFGRIQAIGTTIKAKAWQGTEPTDWDLLAINADHSTGLMKFGSVNGENAAHSIDYDDLLVAIPGANIVPGDLFVAQLTINDRGQAGALSAVPEPWEVLDESSSAELYQALLYHFAAGDEVGETVAALWFADHEDGTLDEWGDGGPTADGGIFTSGDSSFEASTEQARSGTYSFKTVIDTSTQQSGVRAFRWKESHFENDIHYSVWMYFPAHHVVDLFWNIFTFKARRPDPFTENEGILSLVVGNDGVAGAMRVYLFYRESEFGGVDQIFTQSIADIPVGEWVNVEAFLHSAGDDTGVVRYWQDGVQILELTNIQTHYSDGWNQWDIANYSNGLDPAVATIYFDTAVVSAEQIYGNTVAGVGHHIEFEWESGDAANDVITGRIHQFRYVDPITPFESLTAPVIGDLDSIDLPTVVTTVRNSLATYWVSWSDNVSTLGPSGETGGDWDNIGGIASTAQGDDAANRRAGAEIGAPGTISGGSISTTPTDTPQSEVSLLVGVAMRGLQIEGGAERVQPYSAFATVYQTVAGPWRHSHDELILKIQDLGAKLKDRLQLLTYAGTGGKNGTSDLAGRTRPLGFGAPANITLQLVDPANFIFQANAGAVFAVDQVYDRGAALAFDQDYATFEALAAATVANGTFATCLAEGYVKVGGGADPGSITAYVRFDESATHASTIRRIVFELGPLVLTEIDDASFTAFAAAQPGEIGIFFPAGDESTVEEVVERVAFSGGAFAGQDGSGLYRVKRLEAPAATPHWVFDEREIVFDAQRSMARREPPYEVPWKSWGLGYDKNWTVQRAADIAAGVDAARKIYLESEYRFVYGQNAQVAQAHATSRGVIRESLLLDAVDAATEADRLSQLYSLGRAVYEIPVKTALFSVRIGETARVTYSRWGLNQGKNFVVIGVDDDGDTGVTNLVVFG